MSRHCLIRNYELMKAVFDNLNLLTEYYQLSHRDISVIQTLCMNHSTYNAYISVETSKFVEPRRTVYRAIDKLENENIVVVINRAINANKKLQLYFTTCFINRVCGEKFGTRYEKWLNWQKEFKTKKGEDSES